MFSPAFREVLTFELVRQDDESAVYRDTETGAEFTAEKHGDYLMFPPGTPIELLMLAIDEEPKEDDL